MKRVLCVILCTILLCGCSNTKKQQNTVVDHEQEISERELTKEPIIKKIMNTPDDDLWKYQVAKRLYEEFCYFYEHRNDDMSNDEYYVDYGEPVQYHSYVNYNLVMAADRAAGIGVYKEYLSADKVEYVRSKCEEIDSKIGTMEIFHFGYSQAGLHYMAIIYEYTTNSFYSCPSCNKIRGDTLEKDFIMEMRMDALVNVYDFYVEDLSNSNEYIDMNINMFYDTYGGKVYEIKKETNLTDKAMDILDKYSREVIPDTVTDVKNKSWNLYCYEHNYVPNVIKVISYGEETLLTNYIPYF